MASRSFSVHGAFNPIIAEKMLTVSYEVRNVVGTAYRYLCAAVPSASYAHRGDGWTRVTVPERDEQQLRIHLNDFFLLSYRKV